jgi:tetratricopeptide (TPR) repeat protein
MSQARRFAVGIYGTMGLAILGIFWEQAVTPVIDYGTAGFPIRIQFTCTAPVDERTGLGDRRGEGNRLANLGATYERLDEIEKARTYWQKALAIYEEIQSPHAETVRGWLEGLDNDEGDLRAERNTPQG